MGRYRFKLSDMIPNAWFYKLRDLGSRKKPTAAKNSSSTTSNARTAQPAAVPPSPAKQAIHPRRASYYIPRPGDRSPDFPSFHPKAVDTKLSARKKARKPRRPPAKLVRSSISSGCSCRSSSLGAMWKAEPMPAVGGGYSTLPDPDGAPSGSSSSRSSGLSSSPPECSTTIDLSSKSSADVTPAHVDLPPILTRPAAGDGGGDDAVTPSWRGRRRRVQYGRVGKVATPRPRTAGGLSGSLAVVKSSSDPRRDFRESMVEMIVENRLKTAKDLEDLLACYLSLNSAEYHDVIVQVFEQIWLDLSAASGP